MSLSNLIRSGNYATAQEAFQAITTPNVEIRDDANYALAGVALVVGNYIVHKTTNFSWKVCGERKVQYMELNNVTAFN